MPTAFPEGILNKRASARQTTNNTSLSILSIPNRQSVRKFMGPELEGTSVCNKICNKKVTATVHLHCNGDFLKFQISFELNFYKRSACFQRAFLP